MTAHITFLHTLRNPRTLLPLALCLLLAGCESAYYGAMEKVGVYKRDLLVDRVEDAQESQEDAQEQFATVLERFMSVVDVEPSRLQSVYNDLNRDFERAEDRAEEVSDRIDAVEDVSEDLFREWEDEIDLISSATLRSSSQRQLDESRRNYSTLIASMRRAEASMEPVLTTFRDHVLFLKHNMNARAVNALQGELQGIEANVAGLIADMETSINQSRVFIEEMNLVE